MLIVSKKQNKSYNGILTRTKLLRSIHIIHQYNNNNNNKDGSDEFF